MTESADTLDLMRRGQAAARVGRRDEARTYLRRAVQLDPQNVLAWLDLAGVEDEPAAKRRCFETALAIEPDNVEARLGLEMLSPPAPEAPPADLAAEDDPAAEDDLEAVIAAASRRLEQAVGPPPPDEVPPDDEVLYCANHPNVETRLRCNRCGKLICTRCAVQTPVGYRCKQCVGQQQAVFYSGGAVDYVIGAIVGLLLGGLAAYLITLLSAWFFSLILGPTIGIGIAEVVRLAVRKRRSRYLWAVVGGGIVAGALPALLLALTSLWALAALGLYLVLAVGAAAARLH
jgi:tetratricopeptide (TPR) repeat protein